VRIELQGVGLVNRVANWYTKIMTKLSLATATVDELSRVALFDAHHMTGDPWDRADASLDDEAMAQLKYLTAKLARAQPTTMNEATVWARAVYPLLELAETNQIRAWAEAPLRARDPFSDTEFSGIVDGVLAPEGFLSGTPGFPYFLVVEGKRGVDACDARPQLIAALLAVLCGNIAQDRRPEAFGCFTVGDLWNFVYAEATIRPPEKTPRLAVTLRWSREYTERTEAEAILRILRWITMRQGD
jgi:hypothetical protein